VVGQVPALPLFPSLTQLADWVDRFTGTPGRAAVDHQRGELTVTDRGWTLRLLWEDGQAGWVYAIEDDAAQLTVDAGRVDSAADLIDGYLRLVTKMAAACVPLAGGTVVALPHRPRARAISRRRPARPRPPRR
jgi:hypothetical protein